MVVVSLNIISFDSQNYISLSMLDVFIFHVTDL